MSTGWAAVSEMARPYANPGNVMDVLHRYRRLNLPATLSAEDLRVVGIPAGAIGRTFGALEFLGLVDGDKTVRDEWRILSRASEEEFKEALAKIVRHAYADIFTRIQPESDPQARVQEAFQRYEPKSQINRMATLFLALCRESGMPTLDTPKLRPTKVQTSGRARITQPSNSKTDQPARATPPPKVIQDKGYSLSPPNGATYTLELRSGGTVTATYAANLFYLDDYDQQWLIGLVKYLNRYRSEVAGVNAAALESTKQEGDSLIRS